MGAPLFLLLAVGCPRGWDDIFDPTPTDSGDTDDSGVSGDDTGTAFVAWHGRVQFDPETESLVATRGIAAFRATKLDFICDISADFVSVGPGAGGCPDCAWSFTTELVSGGTSGSMCDAFIGPTMFDQFGYQDFYFANELDGFGWSEAFTYDYGSYVYDLEQVVWAHLSGINYHGWFLYGYNFSGATKGVQGDRYDATFMRYAANNNGQRLYYYFYY